MNRSGFLSEKNVNIVYKEVRQIVLAQTGIDCDKLDRAGIAGGIINIMKSFPNLEARTPEQLQYTNHQIAIKAATLLINRITEQKQQFQQKHQQQQYANAMQSSPPQQIANNLVNRINASKDDIVNIMKKTEQDRVMDHAPQPVDFSEQERLNIQKLLGGSPSPPAVQKVALDAKEVEDFISSSFNSVISPGSSRDSFFDGTAENRAHSDPAARGQSSAQPIWPTIIHIRSSQLINGAITFSKKIKYSSVAVISAEVPQSQYIIHKNNCWIHWKDTALEIKRAQIPHGDYNIDQLLAAISIVMNAAGNSCYHCVLDPIDSRCSIESVPPQIGSDSTQRSDPKELIAAMTKARFACEPAPPVIPKKTGVELFQLLFDQPNSCFKQLGFKKREYTSALKYKSENRYNLEPEPVLLLYISQVSQTEICKIVFDHLMVGKIKFYHALPLSIATVSASQSPFTEGTREALTQSGTTLNFEWKNQAGDFYDFQDFDWSITLSAELC